MYEYIEYPKWIKKIDNQDLIVYNKEEEELHKKDDKDESTNNNSKRSNKKKSNIDRSFGSGSKSDSAGSE